ncbi:MAG: hypothetical protein A3F90_05440 [Deltaproteobacteria bacterium RIFCSPLOWO2_12_FULL_60_19]|nr:MAG: hypothetical protein A3F90_05440 [Deltaproteobacteria bacterium RIFCSPLOWO2_12_FULL_60_19]
MTEHKLRTQRLVDFQSRLTLPGLLILLLLLTGACGIQIRAGGRPNTDILDKSLSLGKSTRADVLSVLGEPSGKGRALLPMDPKLRTMPMWSYFYMEGTLLDVRQMWLFVYFDEDRYDGYMWFSSVPKENQSPLPSKEMPR